MIRVVGGAECWRRENYIFTFLVDACVVAAEPRLLRCGGPASIFRQRGAPPSLEEFWKFRNRVGAQQYAANKYVVALFAVSVSGKPNANLLTALMS
jgi:hypothetical protein